MRRLLAIVCLLASATSISTIRMGAPFDFGGSTSAVALNSAVSLADGNDSIAWVFMALDSGTVTGFLFRINATTYTDGAPQYKVTLRNVSGDDPSSTIYAAGAFTANDADDAVMKSVAISHDGSGNVLSSYTLTAGTLYAIRVEPCPDSTAPCSGASTPDAGDNITITPSMTATGMSTRWNGAFQTATTDGSSWTSGSAEMPVFGYYSATRSYGYPVLAFNTTNRSEGGQEGMLFTIPSAMCSTVGVNGIRAWMNVGASSKYLNATIYSGTSSYTVVAASGELSTGNFRSAGVFGPTLIRFTSSATLTCGTAYRVVLTPLTGSQNLYVQRIGLGSADHRSAFMFGGNAQYTYRTGCSADCDADDNSGGGFVAFTDDNTQLPFIELLIDDWTVPAGGGGAKWRPIVQ